MSVANEKEIPSLEEMRKVVRKSSPYLYFGAKVSMRRMALERKYREPKYTREGTAIVLKMSEQDYKAIESGKKPLPVEFMPILADHLRVPVQNVMHWHKTGITKFRRLMKETGETEGALKYSNEWKEFSKQFIDRYCEDYNLKEVEPRVLRVLNRLEKDVYRINMLELLPMSTFLILSTLVEQGQDATYLHEIKSVVLEDEGLAPYIERVPSLALYTWYAANELFFEDDPKKSLHDCLNILSIEQFKIIFFALLDNANIYNYSDDLSALQKFDEFSSHGILMARVLKKHLKNNFPKEVNYDELIMGLAAQGLGIQAFYSILKPSLLEDDMSIQATTKQSAYKGIDDVLLERLNRELHPILSAIIASNWKMNDQVVALVMDHHKQPTGEVSVTCALLKLINTFVDDRFDTKDRAKVLQELEKYPQLQLDEGQLLEVLHKMRYLRDEIVQQSSSIINSKSKEASKVTQDYIQDFAEKSKKGDVPAGHVKLIELPTESSVRFNPELQRALIHECYFLSQRFTSEMRGMRKGESFEGWKERSVALELALQSLKTESVKSVAHKCNLKPEDLLKTFKNIS